MRSLLMARAMSSERIHRVPVIEGDRVAGIITSLNLISVFPSETESKVGT